MSSRRVLKVAEAVREVVALSILTDLKDPRIQDVTVTFVEVSADLRIAKVHVSVMGDEAKQRLSLRGLRNSAGYLQQKIAHRVDLRYTPTLRFVLDKGIKNAFAVSRILDEVLPAERQARPAPNPLGDPARAAPSHADDQPAPGDAAAAPPQDAPSSPHKTDDLDDLDDISTHDA